MAPCKLVQVSMSYPKHMDSFSGTVAIMHQSIRRHIHVKRHRKQHHCSRLSFYLSGGYRGVRNEWSYNSVSRVQHTADFTSCFTTCNLVHARTRAIALLLLTYVT